MRARRNQYYILPANQIRLVNHPSIVEDKNSIRWDNDKTRFLCKSRRNLKLIKHLEDFIMLNYRQMRVEMEKRRWGNLEPRK